jgi:hypothetical protein
LFAMGESLTTQRRVEDEDFRIVNSFRSGRMAGDLIRLQSDGTERRSPG